MAIAKELWLPIIIEKPYPDNSFILRSRNLDEHVTNNILHLAEAGIDPEVLIDNTSYPIPIVSRTDIPHDIPLHTFDTENTVVRNVEAKEVSYGKMKSVTDGHKESIAKKSGRLAAFNWCPQKDSPYTPVIKTTGTVKNGFKDITFSDLIDLDALFNDLDLSNEGRILVLNPIHRAGLLREDAKAYKNLMESRKFLNFEVFLYSQTPTFDVTTGEKQPFGSIVGANSVPASFAYMENYVCRANGDIDMFVTYNSPTERGDVIGFQKRFTALPIINKYIAAIYSDK